MRKFFTLIAAVLLSMTTLQATVVTRNLGWTLDGSTDNVFTVNQWESATKWEWTPGVGDYDQLVVDVADHDYDIAVTVFCSDGESDFEAKGLMRPGTNSIGVALSASIIKGVSVQNFSGNDDVTITVTAMYLRGAVGSRKTITLWSGSQHFDDFAAWGTEIHLAASDFADAHAGDILEISYSLDADTYYQFKIETPWNHNYPEFLGTLDEYNQYNINKDINPSRLQFTIMSSTDLSNLQNDGGLYINGKHLTVSSIKLIKHEVLWTGEQATGNWANAVEVAAAKLADVKVGNIICVRVSALTTENWAQVALWYNNGSWTDFAPSVNYLFQEGDEAPMVVEFTVTHKMKKLLTGNSLLVRGNNYTMTDIYVLEGTPAANVAAFLNVTSAGMATYVLPFDVPTLPAGVKAYRLTNDGSDEIEATEVSELTADQPVLIIANKGEYEFLSEDGASDDVSGKTGTFTDGALVGTYQTIAAVSATTATNYNYVLQNGTDGVAFYQVKDATCSIAPYHAYLSCGYNALGSSSPAPMRIRYVANTATGIDETNSQKSKVESRKIIEDGQLFILRDGKTYNALGQMVK